MMALMNTNREQWQLCPSELEGFEIGQLITPAPGFSNHNPDGPFAVDNCAYSKGGFDAKRFCAILEREKPNRKNCLWVSMPDVVGCARRTLEAFDIWAERLGSWPRALVLQEGIEDFEIPWRRLAAVFIGGGDSFKTSNAVRDVCKCAKLLGKPIHMGRVNGVDRMLSAMNEIGCDSFDGSGISQYSHMRLTLSAALRGHTQKEMFEESEAA